MVVILDPWFQKKYITQYSMNKINLIVLFLLMTLLANSQNVVIKGVATNQSNKMIRVITYSDLFSGIKKTLATTQTNSNGDFLIKLNVNKTIFSFLAFELDKGEFYLSPGSTYDFIIHLKIGIFY